MTDSILTAIELFDSLRRERDEARDQLAASQSVLTDLQARFDFALYQMKQDEESKAALTKARDLALAEVDQLKAQQIHLERQLRIEIDNAHRAEAKLAKVVEALKAIVASFDNPDAPFREMQDIALLALAAPEEPHD